MSNLVSITSLCVIQFNNLVNMIDTAREESEMCISNLLRLFMSEALRNLDFNPEIYGKTRNKIKNYS